MYQMIHRSELKHVGEGCNKNAFVSVMAVWYVKKCCVKKCETRIRAKLLVFL